MSHRTTPSEPPQPDRGEIARAFQLLKQPGDVVELRCPKTNCGTVSGLYNDANELVKDTNDIGTQAAPCSGRVLHKVGNVYWTLQTLKPVECQNGYKGFTKHGEGVSDQMVAEYRWLPLDFDPIRFKDGQKTTSNVSSTDQEKAASFEVAKQVQEYLRSFGVQTILADSGNGAHLLVKICLPATPENEQLLSALLNGFAEVFNTPQVGVDTGVFNPSRIWKVYGTVARKGEHSAERPHRLARILNVPPDVQVVSEEKLREILAALPKPVTSPATKEATTTSFTTTFKEFPRNADGKILVGSRYEALMSHLGTMWNRGYDREELVADGVEWARDNFELGAEEFNEALVTGEIEHYHNTYGDGQDKRIKFTQQPDSGDRENPVVPASTPAAPVSQAQVNADAAAEASNGVTGRFPTTDSTEGDVIPAFDDSVITGIFREIVDLAAGGTTIPRQFPFLVAKVYVGARMADGMTFEGMSDKSTMYGTPIGETGTSKDLSWRRTAGEVLLPKSLLDRKVKVFQSADSGAGLRDAFFEPPMDLPIILRIGEVRSLGHKAGEKKNPEIVDTMIELANDHDISRVKAKRSKRDKPRSHDKAYLAVYMRGQNGEAFMSSFPGRKDMGLWDRFYPEYSDPIEAGDLPDIDTNSVLQLLARLEKFPFTGHMKMGEGVKDALTSFWNEQPKDVKMKVRFKSHVMLDMYFAAWSQGRMVATVEDLDVAIRTFRRQVIIRRVHFREEVPDRVGHYIGLLKTITESMRKRLNKGEPMEKVAMSIRDFQTDTHAYRDNEIATFNIAWRNFHADHLAAYKFTARNGHQYTKYLPMPYEDEMWCATPAARAAFEAAEANSAVPGAAA